MPDSTTFIDAARLLRRAAEEARGLNQPVVAALGPEVISGGALAESVEQFVADAGAEAEAVADELDALAQEAIQRADEAAEAEAAAAAAVAGSSTGSSAA